MSVSYEDTKFHEAARFNDVDLLNQAIRERVDPNAIGLYEWTALHEAVLGGDVIITSKLLQNGADPSVRDLVNGSTPMHLAAGEGNLAILRLLVENGGNIDVRDDGGKTVYDVTEDVLCKKFLKEIREKRTLNAKESKETKLYLAKKVLERGMSQLDVEHVVKFEENVDVPEVLLSVEYNLKSGSLKIRVRKVKRMRRPDGEWIRCVCTVHITLYIYIYIYCTLPGLFLHARIFTCLTTCWCLRRARKYTGYSTCTSLMYSMSLIITCSLYMQGRCGNCLNSFALFGEREQTCIFLFIFYLLKQMGQKGVQQQF